jgi:large subunit ribosomal protein L20
MPTCVIFLQKNQLIGSVNCVINQWFPKVIVVWLCVVFRTHKLNLEGREHMARIKRSVVARTRNKNILKKAKGYYGARSRTYRVAFQAVMKAGQYAYRDRRQKKRQFRKLWITRINAAAHLNCISYSSFINGLKKASIDIDRKVLADIAVFDKVAFTALVNKAKGAIA